MIPKEIYGVGGRLGLENKEIQDLIFDNSEQDSTDVIDVLFSPVDNYKVGLYGTISINDF